MTAFLSNIWKRAVLFWKSILWGVFMLVLFLLPSNNLSGAPSTPFLAESAHIVLFAVFTWFLVREQAKNGSKPGKNNYVIALILGLFFGILIEFLQEVSNLGRTAEIKDVLFDLCGILLSFGILILIFRRQGKDEFID